MTTITVKIPGGNTCNGCDYLKTAVDYDEPDKHICAIFENEIKNRMKCIGCKICMKEEMNSGYKE